MSDRVEYDASSQTIKVYRTMPDSKTLIPNDEIRKWSKVVQEAKDDMGRDVKGVRYIFDDPEAAKYNQQPLTFAGLQTYIQDGTEEAPLGDDPKFSIREDFGIDGK